MPVAVFGGSKRSAIRKRKDRSLGGGSMSLEVWFFFTLTSIVSFLSLLACLNLVVDANPPPSSEFIAAASVCIFTFLILISLIRLVGSGTIIVRRVLWVMALVFSAAKTALLCSQEVWRYRASNRALVADLACLELACLGLSFFTIYE